MSQIALPLAGGPGRHASRIVVGNANQRAVDALRAPQDWPFRTAVLAGPPRSGKSMLARWFVAEGAGGHLGEAIDDAEGIDETELFHRWNRAQELGHPLLIVCNREADGWRIALPDLASRLGAALHLAIGEPDDAMLGELIALHAELRGLVLDPSAAAYLVPRCERSHMGAERLVETIDRLSLERKQPPTLGLWRDALEEIGRGASQPRLL